MLVDVTVPAVLAELVDTAPLGDEVATDELLGGAAVPVAP